MLKDLYKEKMKIEDKIYSKIKDLKIYPNDIKNNVLTNDFFNRSDLNDILLADLKYLTNNLKEINISIYKMS